MFYLFKADWKWGRLETGLVRNGDRLDTITGWKRDRLGRGKVGNRTGGKQNTSKRDKLETAEAGNGTGWEG